MREPSTAQKAIIAIGLLITFCVLADASSGCGYRSGARSMTAQQCVDACAPRQVHRYEDGLGVLEFPDCLCAEAAR